MCKLKKKDKHKHARIRHHECGNSFVLQCACTCTSEHHQNIVVSECTIPLYSSIQDHCLAGQQCSIASTLTSCP